MKITYRVYVNEHCYHNVERDVPGYDYEGILRDFSAALDLRQLRHESALREAANREAERRLEVLTPAVEEPPVDNGPHKNVFEYDGAFRCMDCEKDWGALSGAPRTPPAECRFEQCESTLNPEIRCELVGSHKGTHERKKGGLVRWENPS